jgi:hypothetical protein
MVLGRFQKKSSAGTTKEAERRLNEVLKQISHTGIRRRKMEQKSSEKTKPKLKKIRVSLNAPKFEWVSLSEDLNGCVLVIPEISEVNEHIPLYQGRLSEYHL